MLNWLADSWLSCRKYTERVSRSMEEPLSPWEKAGYLFHHYICFFCRRFNKQVHQLEGDLKRYSQYIANEDVPALPEDARRRILEKLRSKI